MELAVHRPQYRMKMLLFEYDLRVRLNFNPTKVCQIELNGIARQSQIREMRKDGVKREG